eukprot:358810-Chlamydomonas_euryale.AAC.2
MEGLRVMGGEGRGEVLRKVSGGGAMPSAQPDGALASLRRDAWVHGRSSSTDSYLRLNTASWHLSSRAIRAT